MEEEAKMLEVHITGTDVVKPASRTPHLRVFNLSLLDQLVTQMFITVVFHYPSHSMGTATAAEISRRLKTSLSQSLVYFYPLAGRFANDSWVDCSDQGVEFLESRVQCQLQEFLQKPDLQGLSQLVPCHFTCTKSGSEDILLAVQANFFDCGGLALGVGLSHFIGDFATLVSFLNSWASTAHQPTSQASGSVVSQASVFPQRSVPPRHVFAPARHPVMKRFLFSESNIEALRQKRSGRALGCPPTRVEALTALFCRCMARATRKAEATEERVIIATHGVNLRPRMDPPLPDSTFGNFSVMTSTAGLAERELCEDMEGRLEVQLRNSFKKCDGAFIRDLQGPNGYAKAVESMTTAMEGKSGKELKFFAFSSWCRFSVYQVDFGWGKPEWVTPSPSPLKNACLLMDTRRRDGIELWVDMHEEEMCILEQDEELLAFVSPPTIGTA